MKSLNNLNVYRGRESVRDYFNPDIAPPLPLVELPDALNPYRDDGVRIYAKLMTMHPANNVKAMPALNLLQNSVKPGTTEKIVEYSSGSTVISMALVANVFYGLNNVHAFLSNKTSIAKLRLMQFFGLNITLFGGPSQPEPRDGRGGIQTARRLAETSASVLNPNQYENDDNWKSHVRWTGPQILLQLPEINLICAGMGTSGTMTGLGTYFKDNKPSVFRLGVCAAPGERVPGPRTLSLLGPVEFCWKSSVDHIEEVDAHSSYSLSLSMCRQGIVCGPSSGFNLKGLYQYIDKRKAEGTLQDLAGEDGEIHCVTLCCDLPYQYINEYFEKLEDSHFPAMKNEELIQVDLHRYDEAWEKEPIAGLQGFYRLEKTFSREALLYLSNLDAVSRRGLNGLVETVPNTVIVDLRASEHYNQSGLPRSINIPTVDTQLQSPFSDPSVLAVLWKRLRAMVDSDEDGFWAATRDKRVLLVCYTGDASRVATSLLRANGFEADSIRGGWNAIRTS